MSDTMHCLKTVRTNLYSPSLFQVSDINKAVEDVKAMKIRTLAPEPRIGAHGKPIMFLHPKDCNGVLTELEQA